MVKIYKKIIFLIFIIPVFSYAKYTISPVQLNFTNGQNVVSLNLSNDGNEMKHFQLALMRVEDKKDLRLDEKESLVNSKDLLITPVMFKLEAGKSQLIRVAKKDNIQVLGKYRLFIREIPHGKVEQNTIRLVTTFSVPITFDSK